MTKIKRRVVLQNKQLIIEDDLHINMRLDIFVNQNIDDVSRSYIKKLIIDGKITVNSKTVKSGYKLKKDDIVLVNIPNDEVLDIEAEDIPLKIIYEDEYLLIVDKPKGMVVHPAPGNYNGTMVNALLYHCKGKLSSINGVIRPGIVHRIDKDTTGLLVVAKTNEAHSILSNDFKKHKIIREYRAITEGVINEESGIIDAPIGRHKKDRKKMAVRVDSKKNAVTHFEVIDRFKNNTYIKCRLETGRTHQIRVHMAYINHPLLGDELYGRKKQKYITNGQVLHARVLGFIHPIKKEHLQFYSPLPEYFQELIDYKL